MSKGLVEKKPGSGGLHKELFVIFTTPVASREKINLPNTRVFDDFTSDTLVKKLLTSVLKFCFLILLNRFIALSKSI